MAVTPVNATVTVTTAATRVQVTSNAGILPSSVYFEALGSNSGNIFIGLSNVSSTVYIARLTPGSGISFFADSPNGRLGGVGLQLSAYYADTSSSGDKVQVTYQYNTGG